jgi:hypothetical protein
MLCAKARHQRGHMAAPETGRRGNAQVAAGLDAARADAGFGVGQIGQHALAILQKGTALMRQGDAAGGAHQQLDAQLFFQRIQPPAHDGRGHALGVGGRRQAAPGRHRHKRFQRFELVHAADYADGSSKIN